MFGQNTNLKLNKTLFNYYFFNNNFLLVKFQGFFKKIKFNRL